MSLLRVASEAVLIVSSILLAFGLQAWWEEERDRNEEQDYLVALLTDLDAVIDEATRTIHLNDSASARSRARLEASQGRHVPPDSIIFLDMVIYQLRANLDTYEDIISSGSVTQLRDPNVRRRLAALRAELQFERETMTYAVQASNHSRAGLMAARASETLDLWTTWVSAETYATGWREAHVARKRDVIAAAIRAREAIEAALETE